MKFLQLKDLPTEYFCNYCETTKPIGEMFVVHLRREKYYKLRPICKSCFNARQRSHRREYKTKYLQNWRKTNAKLNKSYWNNSDAREKARINAAKRNSELHDAVLIQGRMRRKGMKVSIKEAAELLEKFGRRYPSPQGLTTAGRRECERIRAKLRWRKRDYGVMTNFEIRLMVYEDSADNPSFVIKPHLQSEIYQTAARNMRKYWRERKMEF